MIQRSIEDGRLSCLSMGNNSLALIVAGSKRSCREARPNLHIHNDIVHWARLGTHILLASFSAANKQPLEASSKTIAEEYSPHHKVALARTGRRIASMSSSNDTMK